MRKTYQYRLFPTDAQAEALDVQLGEACRLYNAALQERRDAYQRLGVSLNYYGQANQLKEIRDEGHCGLANFSACQDILRRVEKTFQAFSAASRLVRKPDIRASSRDAASIVTPSQAGAMAVG
jgi:putative transposase